MSRSRDGRGWSRGAGSLRGLAQVAAVEVVKLRSYEIRASSIVEGQTENSDRVRDGRDDILLGLSLRIVGHGAADMRHAAGRDQQLERHARPRPWKVAEHLVVQVAKTRLRSEKVSLFAVGAVRLGVEPMLCAESSRPFIRQTRHLAINLRRLPAATVTGLAPLTQYGVFWRSDVGYAALPGDFAANALALGSWVFVGWQATSDGSGGFPSSPPPPPGWGGGGNAPIYQAETPA